jgi:hypothetical protein
MRESSLFQEGSLELRQTGTPLPSRQADSFRVQRSEGWVLHNAVIQWWCNGSEIELWDQKDPVHILALPLTSKRWDLRPVTPPLSLRALVSRLLYIGITWKASKIPMVVFHFKDYE